MWERSRERRCSSRSSWCCFLICFGPSCGASRDQSAASRRAAVARTREFDDLFGELLDAASLEEAAATPASRRACPSPLPE